MLKSLVTRPLILTCAFLLGCNRTENQPSRAETPAAPLATAADPATSDVDSGRPTLSLPDQPEANVPGGAFRVMTWNLEWFFDNDGGDNFSELAKEQTLATREQWDWKRDAVAKAIFQAQPSLIGLQEIENKRVLFYLRRSLARNHHVAYQELCIEGNEFFTEQDVGLMYRTEEDTEASGSDLPVVDPILVSMFGRTQDQRKNKQFTDVGKHLAVTLEVKHHDATELVTVVVVHLRAKEEGIEIRTRQARLVHAWVAEKIKHGENVIVMGDLNTDESVFPPQPGSDMFAILGLETPDTDDDLIDLHGRLATSERQTHLLHNKMFDRILVSPSLVHDDAARTDLVFTRMQRMRDLSVQNGVDEPEQHWDHYWEIDNGSRDISDHWPIMATFEWK